MKLNYQEHSLKSGIYKILNTHTGRVYIGQAKEFKSRWKDHCRSLLAGKHQNKFLRNDFLKSQSELDHDDFLEFYILEVMEGSTKEERNQREEQWIAEYWDNQRLCYNFKQKATNTERSGYSSTPEKTRAKQAEAARLNWLKPEFRQLVVGKNKGKKMPARTKEHCAKIALKHKGKHHSLETRKKMSETHKTKEVQLKFASTYQKHRSHIISRIIEAISLKHILINPSGDVVEVTNLNKWCKEQGLYSSGFSNLLRKGKDATYKGWKYFGHSKKQSEK